MESSNVPIINKNCDLQSNQKLSENLDDVNCSSTCRSHSEILFDYFVKSYKVKIFILII